jgi:multidrug efflux system membrane fusion protein
MRIIARRSVGVLIILALMGAGGSYALRRGTGTGLRAAQPGAPPQPQAVPVAATTVGRRDVPIYLDGLGTVQAYFTVTVHSQITARAIPCGFPMSAPP